MVGHIGLQSLCDLDNGLVYRLLIPTSDQIVGGGGGLHMQDPKVPRLSVSDDSEQEKCTRADGGYCANSLRFALAQSCKRNK
jgi:hypothetical protein